MLRETALILVKFRNGFLERKFESLDVDANILMANVTEALPEEWKALGARRAMSIYQSLAFSILETIENHAETCTCGVDALCLMAELLPAAKVARLDDIFDKVARLVVDQHTAMISKELGADGLIGILKGDTENTDFDLTDILPDGITPPTPNTLKGPLGGSILPN